MDISSIQAGAQQLEGCRRTLQMAWDASSPAWNDLKREQLGRTEIEPLLQECRRYQQSLDEAMALAQRALTTL